MEAKKAKNPRTLIIVLIILAVASAVMTVVMFSQYRKLNKEFETLCDEYNETYEKNYDTYYELKDAGIKIDKGKLVNEYE